MASVADEVAALRGTRAATLKDLLTHPAFSRLLAAMSISSLGDWVGFVAVTSLVTTLVRVRREGRVRDQRGDGGPHAAGDPVRADRGSLGRSGRPQADHDRRRHRTWRHVRVDGVHGAALGDLPVVVRDRVPVAAVVAGARRIAPEHGAAPPTRQRELDRPGQHLRHVAAGRGRLRGAHGLQLVDRRARRVPRATVPRRWRCCWTPARSPSRRSW